MESYEMFSFDKIYEFFKIWTVKIIILMCN